ncbi:MAG TPA: AsmA family protein, partial [Nevskiaceae bacterium]|nr:AsmA family protein [Nevskiaceae bacterium]
MDGTASPESPTTERPPASVRPTRRSRPVVRYFEKWVLAVLLVLLVVLLWDWNWFVPVIEKRASAALGREVTIGNLDVDLGEHPRIVVDDLALANPDEFTGEPTMVHVKRLAVRADLPGFFHHRVYVDEITLDETNAFLGRGPSGQPNWIFEALQGPEPPPEPDAQPWVVEVAQLAVAPSTIRFVDPLLKSDFTVHVKTQAAPETGEQQIVVDVEGTYSGQPVEGRLTGGSALTLRDETKPYPVDLKLANGATKVRANGTLLRPLEFGGAKVQLEFTGHSLADLFPLTSIPLPETAPYRLTGHLDYNERRIRFKDFEGRVGSSDLSGTVTVDPHGVRPFVTAELASKQVVFADLGGLVGATPGEAKATDPAELKRERAEAAKKPRVLPDTPINLPKLRAADLDVHYKADKIVSDSMPFDNMDVALGIVDGDIAVKPILFRVGEGRILANVALDADEKDVIRTRAEVDDQRADVAARHVQLHRAVAARQHLRHGIAGRVQRRAPAEPTLALV